MLAQNVIFPSIAPSHVPTPLSLSLFLSSPPLSDCAQDNADRDGGGVPNEVHKSGSRSPFSCVVRLRTIFIHFLRSRSDGLRE